MLKFQLLLPEGNVLQSNPQVTPYFQYLPFENCSTVRHRQMSFIYEDLNRYFLYTSKYFDKYLRIFSNVEQMTHLCVPFCDAKSNNKNDIRTYRVFKKTNNCII